MLTTTVAQKEEALAAANVILDGVLRIYQGMNILISVCGHSGQSRTSFVDECVTGSLSGGGENRKFPIMIVREVGGITYYRAPCLSECKLLRVHDGGDTMVPPVVLDLNENIVVAGVGSIDLIVKKYIFQSFTYLEAGKKVKGHSSIVNKYLILVSLAIVNDLNCHFAIGLIDQFYFSIVLLVGGWITCVYNILS